MPEDPDQKDKINEGSSPSPANASPRDSSQDTLLQALSEVEKEPRPTLISSNEPHFNINNPQPDSIKPAHSKKKLIIVSLAAAILLVFAAAGTGFALWYTNPDKVMTDAVVNVATARTTIADGEFLFKDNKNKGNVSLSFNSKADTPNFKGQLDATLKVNYDKYKFNLGGSGLLSENGNLYFKFDGVKKVLNDYIEEPEISTYAEATPDLKKNILAFANKIDGKWVKLDQAAIKDMWANFNHAQAKTCFANAYDAFDKDPSQKSEIAGIYDQNRFIIIKGKGSETVNNVDSVKYTVGADVAKYYKASDAFAKTTFGKAIDTCGQRLSSEKQTDRDKADEKKYRDKNAKNEQKDIDQSKLTVWVSRWNHEFTKTSFERSDIKDKTHTSLVMNYKINQKIDAKEPAQSIPLKEFQADIDNIQKDLYGNVESVSTKAQVEASKVMGGVASYQANNRGAVPTVATVAAFAPYVDATNKTNPLTLADGYSVSFKSAAPTSPTAATAVKLIEIWPNALCDDDLVHVIAGGTARQVAVVTKLEDGTSLCIPS